MGEKNNVPRQVALIALGAAVLAKEKIEGIVQILVEKGKANEGDVMALAGRLFEKGRRLKQNFGGEVMAEIHKLASKVEKTTRPNASKE